ncbi:MAG: type 1 glutamine amidotransferase [Bacteroidales bacterium]|nr:type 1 glutamine amidotransferase [Bacteroidales bacterium]
MNITLRIHIFQHVPFEGPAAIKVWAEKNGHMLSYTRFFNNDKLPEPDEIDWLVIMGGPMGVYDQEQYPWLKTEIDFIRKAMEQSKVVIGICLGAQLIAAALGAKVHRGSLPEIGWFPIRINPKAANQNGLGFLPPEAVVFHWHQDTFEIPEGATLLASSEAFPNQAFVYGNRVLALQFHFEMDETALKSIISNGHDELVSGTWVQTAPEILNRLPLIKENNSFLFHLLDGMANKT